MDTSYMVPSYGETSGFAPAAGEELEAVNGGGGGSDKDRNSSPSEGCRNAKCRC